MKREASVKVLVVVVRHGEQWRPAVPHDARGGENVSGREGDVLGFRHRGGPFSATQQRPLQHYPDPSRRVADSSPADEPERGRELRVACGSQTEDSPIEQCGFVEEVERLGEGDMIDSCQPSSGPDVLRYWVVLRSPRFLAG